MKQCESCKGKVIVVQVESYHVTCHCHFGYETLTQTLPDTTLTPGRRH